MKTPIVTGISAFAIAVAGCGKKPPSRMATPSVLTNYSLKYTDEDFKSDLQKLIALSDIVAYGTMETNNAPILDLIVSDIWKGGSEAAAVGITNGTHFPIRWSVDSRASIPGGHLPDAGIIVVPHATSHSIALERREVFYVWDGQIEGLTMPEFKARFGL